MHLVITSDRRDLIPGAIAFTVDGCRFMSFASTVQHRNRPRRSAAKSVRPALKGAIIHRLKATIHFERQDNNSEEQFRGEMANDSIRRRDFMKGIAGAAASALPIVPAVLAGEPGAEKAPVERSDSGNSAHRGSRGEPWFVRADPSWVSKLSRPQYEIQFEFNIKIPARDGIMLAANVWRPKAKGKFPIVYLHYAYDKSNTGFAIVRAKYFVPRGYAVVAVDCRGRYDSGGDPYFLWHTDWRKGGYEGQDVQDCLNWLGVQEWSSGKIGMAGPSYLGFTQWMGATEGSPHLTTIIPYCSPDDHHDNIYPNGAFQLTNSMHILSVLGGSRTNNFNLETDWFDWDKAVHHLPVKDIDREMLGKSTELWKDFMEHPDNDYYWRFSVGDRSKVGEMSAGRYPQVKVPTLNITGWYDQVSQATINGYLGMTQFGPEALRNKHHLIVGPWEHRTGVRVVGDIDFGPQASAENLPSDLRWDIFFQKPIELRWYDFWLKGIENGMLDEPPVNIFVMGENKWRNEMEWPLTRAVATKYYPTSSGHANSRYGDGRLRTGPPAGMASDTFVYDPEDPVPTFGCIEKWQGYGIPNSDGPRDQRLVQG
jgi:putative CocE/NonD family hydrolase